MEKVIFVKKNDVHEFEESDCWCEAKSQKHSGYAIKSKTSSRSSNDWTSIKSLVKIRQLLIFYNFWTWIQFVDPMQSMRVEAKSVDCIIDKNLADAVEKGKTLCLNHKNNIKLAFWRCFASKSVYFARFLVFISLSLAFHGL